MVYTLAVTWFGLMILLWLELAWVCYRHQTDPRFAGESISQAQALPGFTHHRGVRPALS